MKRGCERGKMKKRGYQLMVARDTVKHQEEVKIHICVEAPESKTSNGTELPSSLRIQKPGSKVIACMFNPIQ